VSRFVDRLPRPLRHWWALLGLSVLIVFALIQLVPYRVDNPPVKSEPAWDSPRTRQLAKVACFDCHSNETHTYAWEDVAPISWWITNHVKEGRDALNFSEWGTGRGEGADDAIETIRNGSMPPSYYTWLGLHSDAKLSAKERQELIDGLRRTFASSPSGSTSG
jgi:mono/diheme cytochrome c family protein